MNIAVIPARGGSKRIPRKNVREFCDRPMITWPIVAAAESGLFDHIIVSTDDEEIADIAGQAGAETPFVRPADLADDHTGTTDVVVHALNWAKEAGWEFEAACCIYATAAFISPEDLTATHELLSTDCDFVLPAVRYGHPPQRGFTSGQNGRPELVQPEHQSTRTQDLPPVYHDAGQFYWGKRDAWLEQRPILGPRARFIELQATDAWDIDNPQDLAIAELLFQRRLERQT